VNSPISLRRLSISNTGDRLNTLIPKKFNGFALKIQAFSGNRKEDNFVEIALKKCKFCDMAETER